MNTITKEENEQLKKLLNKKAENSQTPARKDYEELCIKEKMAAFCDEEILDKAYGIKYGEYDIKKYGEDFCKKMKLARGRLKTLEKEIADKKAKKEMEKPFFSKKLECGCTVYSCMHIMNSSRGSCCQECYDEMSNGCQECYDEMSDCCQECDDEMSN